MLSVFDTTTICGPTWVRWLCAHGFPAPALTVYTWSLVYTVSVLAPKVNSKGVARLDMHTIRIGAEIRIVIVIKVG